MGLGRAIPWADPRTGAIFVGVLDLAVVVAPAMTYLLSYVFWEEGMLDNIDPYNVFPKDTSDKGGLLFVMLYYFPPAGLALFLGSIVLLAAYLESYPLMIVAVALNTILIIGSSCIVLLMLVYGIRWFLILPLFIPTLMEFYYLWILCDYKEHLEDAKPSPDSSEYTFNEEKEEAADYM